MSGTDWPLLDYAISWLAGPASDPVQDYWCALTDRTEGSTTVTRGKEYELGQVQPGEMTFTFRNDDGAFDPSNGASPFYPNVVPYRLTRLRAQYPATANLLTADQATAFYATQGAVSTSTLPQWIHADPSAGAVTIVPLSGTSNAYQVPAGSPTFMLRIVGFSVRPGAALSAQVQFSTSSSQSLHLAIDWIVSTGTAPFVAGTTVTGTAGTATVSGTAPANAIGALISVYPSGAGTLTAAVKLSNIQVEQAAAPTTWTTPGTWYSLYTGYVERWPQAWDADGNYGTADITAVDRFTWFANRGMNYAAYLEMLQLGPDLFYPLDEQSGATAFADAANKRPPVGLRKVAAGSATLGSSLAGGNLPVGISGQVLTFNNPQTSGLVAASTIDLSTVIPGGVVGPPTSGAWSRMFAFHSTDLRSGDTQILWSAVAVGGIPLGFADQYTLIIDNLVAPLGQMKFAITKGGALLGGGYVNCGFVLDSGWHFVVITMNTFGTICTIYLDGVQTGVLNTGANLRPNIVNGTDQHGGFIKGNTAAGEGFAGDMSCLAQTSYALTATQVSNLYQAFRYGWGSQSPTHTESSDVRYQRLLNWVSVTGTPRISAGASVMYGPATDITPATRLLDALQNVVDTEAGQHFIGADGQTVFQSRRDRNNKSPTVTFGEHVGEIAYTGASTDFDPTMVINDATVTAQYGAGAEATSYRVTDGTSASFYGDISASRTVNTIDNAELLSTGQFMVYEGKQPQLRMEALPVDVGANPTYWPTLLGLDLGACVTVNRRPSNAPAISMNGSLEQIAWSIDDQRNCTWSAQVSNAALHQFGAFNDPVYGLFDSTLIFGY